MENISLTANERQKLLAVLREMDHHAPEEKRSESRHKVLLDITIRTIAGRRCTRHKATLVNVAKRGLGLIVPHQLPKGSRFIVPLRFHDGGGWLVLCEVQSCVEHRTGYKVGARFQDRIDDPKGNAAPPMDWLI